MYNVGPGDNTTSWFVAGGLAVVVVIVLLVWALSSRTSTTVVVAAPGPRTWREEQQRWVREVLSRLDLETPLGHPTVEQWSVCGQLWKEYEERLEGFVKVHAPKDGSVIDWDAHRRMARMAQYLCLEALPAAAASVADKAPTDPMRQLITDLRPWGPVERDATFEKQWNTLWSAPATVAFLLSHLNNNSIHFEPLNAQK